MLKFNTILVVILLSAASISGRTLRQTRNHKNESSRHNPAPPSDTTSSNTSDLAQGHLEQRSGDSALQNPKQGNEPFDDSTQTQPTDLKRDFIPSIMDKEAPKKAESRRGLKIGLHMKLPTTKRMEPANKRKQIIENILQEILNDTVQQDTAAGAGSDIGQALGIFSNAASRSIIKPAYECEDWDPKYRMCILERNMGDSVTFYLSTGKSSMNPDIKIIWKKEFHIKDSTTRHDILIDPENCPENIIIGNRGHELRISPITEIDVGLNLFSAALEGESGMLAKLLFMIRIVPIDLGFVYVGETIEINLRSYLSLPSNSLTFRWYMEKNGEHGTLPSNMKVTATGSSIKISELRQDQEGILDCSVYTNQNFLATKKRFLVKDLDKNFDVLQKTPDHSIRFKESTLRRSYNTQEHRRIRREAADELFRKALAESTISEETADAKTLTEQTSKPYDQDYNLDADVGIANDRPDTFVDADTQPLYNTENTQRGQVGQRNHSTRLDNIPDNSIQPPPFSANQNLQPYDTMLPPTTIDKPLKASNPDFIVNIDNFPQESRVSAEEKTAQIISYCINDSDCSERAVCVRDNIKKTGFCKCLPGSTGIGIFCRENVWINSGNFRLDRENLQNLEDSTSQSIVQ